MVPYLWFLLWRRKTRNWGTQLFPDILTKTLNLPAPHHLLSRLLYKLSTIWWALITDVQYGNTPMFWVLVVHVREQRAHHCFGRFQLKKKKNYRSNTGIRTCLSFSETTRSPPNLKYSWATLLKAHVETHTKGTLKALVHWLPVPGSAHQ